MPDDIEKELGLVSEVGGAGFRELMRQIGKDFGGPKGISKKMRQMWEDEATPAATKHSIMALVFKAHMQEAEENAKTDFSQMSREELVAYIKRLMHKHDDKLPEVLEPVQ